MRACWLKWVGRDWSISADYIWLNYSGANKEDGCRWQLVDKDGSCVDGQFKRTDDPNILILKKENGEEFGTVHVAYISRRRNQGQIYLIRNTEVTRFYLVSTDPAFTVESGEVDSDS